jgi:hypothetical protein
MFDLVLFARISTKWQAFGNGGFSDPIATSVNTYIIN